MPCPRSLRCLVLVLAGSLLTAAARAQEDPPERPPEEPEPATQPTDQPPSPAPEAQPAAAAEPAPAAPPALRPPPPPPPHTLQQPVYVPDPPYEGHLAVFQVVAAGAAPIVGMKLILSSDSQATPWLVAFLTPGVLAGAVCGIGSASETYEGSCDHNLSRRPPLPGPPSSRRAAWRPCPPSSPRPSSSSRFERPPVHPGRARLRRSYGC